MVFVHYNLRLKTLKKPTLKYSSTMSVCWDFEELNMKHIHCLIMLCFKKLSNYSTYTASQGITNFVEDFYF